jgi:hypothetical protein
VGDLTGDIVQSRSAWWLVAVALVVGALLAWALVSLTGVAGDLNAATAVEYGLIA